MFYELRTYAVYPDKLPELLRLWETVGKRLIDRHMNCVGLWTTETGTLNRVVHLYAWRDHSHRDRARLAFYALPEAKSYVAQVKPLYQSQETVFLSPVSFFPITIARGRK